MASQQVPGLTAAAVAAPAVPAEMVAPTRGHPLHQSQGVLAGWLQEVAMPGAGQVPVREDYLPRVRGHAEPFSNVQSQRGRAAPTTSQLRRQAPPWGG